MVGQWPRWPQILFHVNNNQHGTPRAETAQHSAMSALLTAKRIWPLVMKRTESKTQLEPCTIDSLPIESCKQSKTYAFVTMQLLCPRSVRVQKLQQSRHIRNTKNYTSKCPKESNSCGTVVLNVFTSRKTSSFFLKLDPASIFLTLLLRQQKYFKFRKIQNRRETRRKQWWTGTDRMGYLHSSHHQGW